jgi:hypothetical protein
MDTQQSVPPDSAAQAPATPAPDERFKPFQTDRDIAYAIGNEAEAPVLRLDTEAPASALIAALRARVSTAFDVARIVAGGSDGASAAYLADIIHPFLQEAELLGEALAKRIRAEVRHG